MAFRNFLRGFATDGERVGNAPLIRTPMYGAERFVRRIVPIGDLHRRICYHGYGRMVARYGLAVTALAFSKLAMHWFSAAYAIRHGIAVVADGAVPYMELYPDQNEQIGLLPLRRFYRALGIDYQNPVFHLADHVEELLYDKGITLQPWVRGTEKDKQVFYLEQVILALFLKYYLTTHGKEKYVAVMSRLFEDRLQFMSETISDWRGRPSGSLLERLLAAKGGPP